MFAIVLFSIAFIALAAKLAKADGRVTRDEVTMFRHIFEIPPEEESNAARVFNLCRQDVAGFEVYARQINKVLRASDSDCSSRAAVLDGLFHIAMADGEYHPKEAVFLQRVSEIFGISEHVFRSLRAHHVPEYSDPWLVLGVHSGVNIEELKRVRREFLKANHSDRLVSEGLPVEMIALADARLAAFNAAYDEVRAMMLNGSPQ